MKEDFLANRALQNSGQNIAGSKYINNRFVYPAVVVPFGTNDNTEQNRIRARIVSVNDDGKIQGKSASINEENYNNYAGKDSGILDRDLVLCIPLLPEFFHVRPQVGEMVYVIIENPTDPSSIRYWIGPIISSKLKLRFQNFEDAFKMFNKTSFISNTKTDNDILLSNVFPSDSDVALQGRNDADLILKNREALLVAGKFSDLQNLKINFETPSFLRLKQVSNTEQKINNGNINYTIKQKIIAEVQKNDDKFKGSIVVIDALSGLELINDFVIYSDRANVIDWLKQQIFIYKKKYPSWSFTSNVIEFKDFPNNFYSKETSANNQQINTSNEDLLMKYSEALLTSTIVNIYSPLGKFRGDDIKNFEKNKTIKSFDIIANSLHPVMFGDEAIRLFDLIIRILFEHIHTPQMPMLQTALSDELRKYTVDGALQNLISNYIRVN